MTEADKKLHKLIHSLLKAYGEVIKDPEDMQKMADYGETYMNVFEQLTRMVSHDEKEK